MDKPLFIVRSGSQRRFVTPRELLQVEALCLAENLLLESPDLDKLKKHRRSLSAEEKAQIPQDLPNGDGASVLKAEIDGQTWYACYTHRAYQARKTFKEMLKCYPSIASTA